MFDSVATLSQNGIWVAADKGCYRCDCRASWSCDGKGAERLWEVQAWGADVKHTVTEGRQSERQGYCQSLTAAQNWEKHTVPATENCRMKEGEIILLF